MPRRGSGGGGGGGAWCAARAGGLLSLAQRRENVRGAFALRGGVAGQDILLVDDVYTTGATAAECTRVLLLAGARSVYVATLARAGRDIAVRWQPSAEAAARADPKPVKQMSFAVRS